MEGGGIHSSLADDNCRTRTIMSLKLLQMRNLALVPSIQAVSEKETKGSGTTYRGEARATKCSEQFYNRILL